MHVHGVQRLGLAMVAVSLALLMPVGLAGAQSQYAQPPTIDPAQVQQGAQVIQMKGCGGCHTIPGIPGAQGTVGPDLSAHDDVPPVANRNMIATYPNGAVPNNSLNDLAAWISDPPSLKPGTAMPKLGLNPDEAAAAAAYLYSIQADGTVPGMDAGSGG